MAWVMENVGCPQGSDYKHFPGWKGSHPLNWNLSTETARCRYRKNSYQEAGLPTWSRMGKAIQEQMLLDDTTRPV
jgi:hypothetical protein